MTTCTHTLKWNLSQMGYLCTGLEVANNDGEKKYMKKSRLEGSGGDLKWKYSFGGDNVTVCFFFFLRGK